MATKLDSLVVDAGDPVTLARWWAQALGWRLTREAVDESTVEPAEGEAGVPLVFGLVQDPRVVKNRLHLDLRSADAEQQRALVQRLLAAGATRADIGQPTHGPTAVPWVVLADPEGNEFCVLDPRPDYDLGTGSVAAIAVDAAAPDTLAGFWQQATGWILVKSTPGFASLRAPDGRGPYLEFLQDATPRLVKNRLHLDVYPADGADQTIEVARLAEAGARPAEVGQSVAAPGAVTWVVLTDPEGNEFCVLSPR
jgi:predicted enzyme related to lactoylglutathione lyase